MRPGGGLKPYISIYTRIWIYDIYIYIYVRGLPPPPLSPPPPSGLMNRLLKPKQVGSSKKATPAAG